MPASYRIEIVRGAKDGTLNFSSGSVIITTKCWWHPDVVVVAGKYKGAATRMDNREDGFDGGKREAIFFGPGGTPIVDRPERPSGEVFIHKYTATAPHMGSTGCIVVAASEVIRMWSEISPREEYIVEITVRDLGTQKGANMSNLHQAADWATRLRSAGHFGGVQ